MNEKRTRWYGVRVGDIVTERGFHTAPPVTGLKVVALHPMDNNGCTVEHPDGRQRKAVCEWLDVTRTVEEAELYDRAIAAGWTVEPASLYDEEGVEGWCWTSPTGGEYHEVGAWDETPPMPYAVVEAFMVAK